MKVSNWKEKIKKGIQKTFQKDRSYASLSMEKIKILQKQKSILIDVRSYQEYQEGHLEGAICIPVFELESRITKEVPDKQSNIIVYCQSGSRSKKAISILEKLGYNNRYELEGGIDNL